MSATSTMDPEALPLLRGLALERWRVLLGTPPTPPTQETVSTIVGPLVARGDDSLRELWGEYLRWARRRSRGRRFEDAELDELCGSLLALDRYGRVVSDLRRAVVEGLGDGKADRARSKSIEHAFESYLELRNALVHANLGLVHLAVQRLRVDAELHGDLVHEGIFGLVRALERYEPARGTRFSTYAMYWVRSEVVAAYTERMREIRVPRHLLAQRRTFLRARERLDRGQPAPQLLEEARLESGLTESQLAAVESLPTVDSIAAMPEPMQAPVDLDAGRDVAALGPALERLDPRARTIVQHRFELGGAPFLTLNRLGRQLGISRERVRQIEIAALERLHGHLRPEPGSRVAAA